MCRYSLAVATVDGTNRFLSHVEHDKVTILSVSIFAIIFRLNKSTTMCLRGFFLGSLGALYRVLWSKIEHLMT